MRVKKLSHKAKNEKRKLHLQHKRQCPQNSYRKVVIEGDGNCLFRAISQGLFGSQIHHNAVRLQIVNYIIDHWDQYEQFIKGEYQRYHVNNQDDYRQYMSISDPGLATHGGHIEINAAAMAYSVKIAVHLDVLNEPFDTEGESSETIHLLYHAIRVEGQIDSGHYDFLEERDTETFHDTAETTDCANYREKEKVKDKKRKQEKRKMVEFRENEQQRNVQSMKLRRSDEVYRQSEQQRNAQSKKLRRSDDVYRHNEQQRNVKSMKLRRSDEVYRQSEQQRNVKSKKLRRSDEVYRQSEQQRNVKSMKLRRSDEVYRHKEQQRNVESMKLRRSDEVYRQGEQQRNVESMKLRRSDEMYRQNEQQRNAKSKKFRRSDEVYRQAEKEGDARAKKIKRNCSGAKSINELIEVFHKSVQNGPTFVCVCCEQLWYRESVVNYNNIKSKLSSLASSYVNATDDEMSPLCQTCYSYLKQSKLPPCAVANKMSFPGIPPELKLHPLEERLVALRIPFMQIRELPRGRQVSLKGNIVNVIADVSSTVSTLPRTINDSQTIPVKFKRKISYNHAYQVENIRPHKVIMAAKWLVENSPLYKAEKITIGTNWNVCDQNESDDWEEFLQDNDCNLNSEIDEQESCNENVDNNNDDDCDDNNDDWTEEIKLEDQAAGTLDTMLSLSYDRNIDSQGAFCFAPGEGNRPLGIFQDKYSEELSFPTIFCGQPRQSEQNIPVSYSTLCKWELRHKDRRVAKSVPNIFFKLKKLQIQQIKDKASLCLRKCNLKGRKVTAGEVQSPQNVDKIVRLDEGFRVLKTLRGSPPYWESAKRDIFAMIRQIAIPTYFMSFSSAESKWIHLLKILGKTVHEKEYTDNDILNMSWNTKSELIKSDPVTCARHFDHCFQQFMHDFLLSSHHPLGEIQDYFYRVEFQQRGSPHVHMLVWIKDAPQYGENDDDEIINFIDQYITCSNETSDENLAELINYQMHRHAKTCKVKGQCVCRFGFPLPPMPRTMILQPLPMDIDETTEQSLKEHYTRIKTVLSDLQFGEKLSFDEFLDKIQLDEETYIKAIQSSLTSEKIFLKRSPNEIRINNYNEILLKAWRANMDIQFIIDPYACAMYIASYISKAQRGMSNLLARAVDEVREGNQDIRESVRHIGNKFLNHVEVSAQEAVYLTMQMKLRRASRDVIFVNTSPPNDRVILLKPLDEIQNMPANATDIESDNILKKYERRPKALEKLCLADFAAWYTFEREKPDEVEKKDNDDVYNDDNNNSGTTYRVGKLIYKKRTKSKVIRYVRFHKERDSENHYRELVMLFYHWRHENQLLAGCSTYHDRYLQIKQEVDTKQKDYNKNAEALDQAIEAVQNTAVDMFDNIAPNTEHQERQDSAEGCRQSDTMNIFAPQNDSHSQYDIGQDIGMAVNNPNIEELQHPRMPDSQLYPILQILNKKQKEIFYHIIHWIKTKTDPLHVFVTGGAGVGKSVVLKSLYQVLLKHLSSRPGENPDNVLLLLMAPTGKAAYNIKGSTIHSALQIPASQGFHYKPLTSERLNTLQAKYRNLKIIFIDEISMVGNGMFNYINLRLQQIMANNQLFGGVSIVAFGDLYQLKPVFDGWIFNDLRHDYGPLALNIWKDLFKMFELTDIMRQKDDLDFAQLLNRVREGKHTSHDISILKTRIVQTNNGSPPYNDSIVHLYCENRLVDNHNVLVYDRLTETKTNVSATDTVIGDVSETVKQKTLTIVAMLGPQKTMGLVSQLSIGINQRVELCMNLCVDDGLINGTPGVIKFIDGPDLDHVMVLWILFDDSTVGKALRQEKRHLYQRRVTKAWTPITQISRQFRVGRHKNAEVVRKQFPIRPASAKTVHRCQGDTLTDVVVDFSTASNRNQCHIHYVALSRVTKLAGLHITTLQENQISVSSDVTEEMQRMRSHSMLQLCLTFPYDIPNKFIVAYQNVRSLHCHFQDVVNDFSLTSAHVLICSESRLQSGDQNDDYTIPGFEISRHDDNRNQTTRPYHGLVLYSKANILESVPQSHNYLHCEFITAIYKTTFGLLQVVAIYIPPSTPIGNLKRALLNLNEELHNNLPTVILGDFNIDLLQETSSAKQLIELMTNQLKYKQVIQQPTTNYGSCLDHIYTNIQSTDFGVLESYYSDHKPVWVAV